MSNPEIPFCICSGFFLKNCSKTGNSLRHFRQVSTYCRQDWAIFSSLSPREQPGKSGKNSMASTQLVFVRAANIKCDLQQIYTERKIFFSVESKKIVHSINSRGRNFERTHEDVTPQPLTCHNQIRILMQQK